LGLKAILDPGLRALEEVAVIGYGSLTELRRALLSSVQCRHRARGSHAGSEPAESKGERPRPKTILLHSKIVARESTERQAYMSQEPNI